MKKFLQFSAFLCVALVTIGCETEKANEELTLNSVFEFSQECVSVDLLAGQHNDAGDFTIGVNLDGNVVIRYETMNGWQLDYVHLYYGDCNEIPVTRNGNPKIGRFPVKVAMEAGSTVFEYVIEDSIGFCGCIAAHAEVNKDGQSETAWAQGSHFSGNSWAMFIEFCGCPSGPF